MDIEKLKTWFKSHPLQVAVICVAFAASVGLVSLNTRGDNKDFADKGSQTILIQEGMTTADIAALLHEKKRYATRRLLGWKPD